MIFAAPLVCTVLAAVMAASASRRPGEPARAWKLYAMAAALGAIATALAIALAIADLHPRPAARFGALGSVALLAAVAVHLHPHLWRARRERLLDAAQLLVLVGSAGTYFVVVPGIEDGDPVLAIAFFVDLLAFTLAGLLVASVDRNSDLLVARRVRLAVIAAMASHVLVVEEGPASEAGAAVLLAVAGCCLAAAAAVRAPAGRGEPDERPTTPERRWLAVRVLLPTFQVAAFPVLLALAIARDGADPWTVGWFGGCFVLVLLLAFSRQVFLVVDHRRAVVEEREVRRAAQRRNQELEALTGLATTITQTLEEGPIVEQALTVLHTAAGARASALHVVEESRLSLRASAGDWAREHRAPARQMTRLDLTARGHQIGWVTFVRPARHPLTDRQVALLRLLVDQMAIAVQNARDYRETLEQAVRDPLTGLYNRRYLFDALEKEVERARRYGSSAALVLLDADDFKRINDTRGHAVGDEVLREIARVVAPLLRPMDSFARIGGEEFALLLPETGRLQALGVAERVRGAISREPLAGERVTVSAGVGACPEDGDSVTELMRRTDAALYWVKRNGKDRCAVVS